MMDSLIASLLWIVYAGLLTYTNFNIGRKMKLTFIFSFPSTVGVGQVRLCFRERQGDEGQSEDDGELHLQLSECSARTEHMDSSTPPRDRSVRHGAEPDQKLEGSHTNLKKVGRTTHFHQLSVFDLYNGFLWTLFCFLVQIQISTKV